MAGPKYIEQSIAPALNAAAKKAGRAKPRIVASLPLSLTSDVEAAKKFAAETFQVYGTLPVYRACLDAEGVAGPADLALLGLLFVDKSEDEDKVRKGLARLAASGATDFYGSVFPTPGDDGSRKRTMEFLASLNGDI